MIYLITYMGVAVGLLLSIQITSAPSLIQMALVFIWAMSGPFVAVKFNFPKKRTQNGKLYI